MRIHILLIALLSAGLLTACGPKDIGEGSSSDYYNASSREPSTTTADHARYPTDGSRTQQRLYLFNQPAVQDQINERNRNFMNRRLGINSNTPDPMKTPKQASPFREF